MLGAEVKPSGCRNGAASMSRIRSWPLSSRRSILSGPDPLRLATGWPAALCCWLGLASPSAVSAQPGFAHSRAESAQERYMAQLDGQRSRSGGLVASDGRRRTGVGRREARRTGARPSAAEDSFEKKRENRASQAWTKASATVQPIRVVTRTALSKETYAYPAPH